MSRIQGLLEVTVEKANNLPNLDHNPKKPYDLSDPSVVVHIVGTGKDKSKVCQTPTVKDSLNPFWGYTVTAEVNHEITELMFSVVDKDFGKSEAIGFAVVPGNNFVKTKGWGGELQLTNKKNESAGTLAVSVKFSGSSIPSTERTQKKKQSVKANKSGKKHEKENPSESEMITPHTQLHLNIIKAEDLPNMDKTTFNKKNKSDPLVKALFVDKDGEEYAVATTRCIKDNLNPEWNEEFPVNVSHDIKGLVFKLYDKDPQGLTSMGAVDIPVAQLKKDKQIEGKFPVIRKDKSSGTLQVSVKLVENAK